MVDITPKRRSSVDTQEQRKNLSKQLELGLSSEDETVDGLSAMVSYSDIHVSQSTFLNAAANRVHRWFRLTPSFGPELVQEMLERLAVRQGEFILDPFSGAGTTLIEAKLTGQHGVGLEVNPLLQFVNEACLDWSVFPDTIRLELPRLYEDLQVSVGVALEDLGAHGLCIPPIHNPTRWWRPDILVQLLFLRRSILATKDVHVRRLLLLALAGSLVPDLTNVTLGRLQLHFIDRTEDDIDVWRIYSKQAFQIADDLEAIQQEDKKHYGSARCFLQDSLDLSGLQLEKNISAVVTSPPYPNRYSYVWNTRPHLYMLGLLNTAREASNLDKRTIGGTWGTATSELSKGIFEPTNSAIATVVGPIVNEIRVNDNLMANYVMHYFNRLAGQIVEMERIVTDDCRLAYVVGNSWIKGVYIETDVLLAEIVERIGLGYRVFDVHRFRRRHSGVRLYESIVYARK